MLHHAFVIEAEPENGITDAEKFVHEELGLEIIGNPDVIVLRYSLFSIEEARKVVLIASQAPLRGDAKALIISTSRLYHEAQNALLKLFEEPPRGTFLFLIVPSVNMLLPTLRSRVQVLMQTVPRPGLGQHEISTKAKEFLAANKEKRSAMIKKLSSGKDEDERRENRDEALAIVNGIEGVLARDVETNARTLRELATLHGYLHDRSAPVKMILEHISLVLPARLL